MSLVCMKPVVWRIVHWCGDDEPSRLACPDHLNLVTEEILSEDRRSGAAVFVTRTSREDLPCGAEEILIRGDS